MILAANMIQAPPRNDRACICVKVYREIRQCPKKTHNRMITGIGTPNSQSSIPLPIVSSSNLPKRKRDSARYVPKAELSLRLAYQWPVFGIEIHGSAGGLGSPFCSNSIECKSGERMKAMLPSRGGRLMVMPSFISRSQVA
jgi:hypothetical protein